MHNFFLLLLAIGVILVPFLYRIIRTGKISLFNKKNDFGLDINYQKAEKFRIFQVLIVCLYLIYHSSIYWGWFNTIFFITLVFFISLFSEILGEKTGYIFGGIYKYNHKLTPGPKLFNIPLLIPVAWTFLLYLSVNLYCLINQYEPKIIIKEQDVIFIIPCLIMVCLDLVLDPIAVDEKRWEWNKKSLYYDVPLLNFLGWFLTSLFILSIFSTFSKPYESVQVEGVRNKYIPGLLLIYIHLAASRPCFERGLKIPGIFAIFLCFVYIIKIFFNS